MLRLGQPGPPTIAEARRRFDRYPSALRIYHPAFANLEGQDGDVTSQNGEDGLIAAIFDQIGTRNRWCFEVGAADGLHLSNTFALRRDGWHALLIEADPRLYAALTRFASPRVQTRLACIGPHDLDMLLIEAGAPPDLDLGVIDIDGEDVAAWRGLVCHRPRVMVVEYNPAGDCIQGGRSVWQAGLETVAALGQAKGYVLVATVYCNGLFVREDCVW